MCFNIVFCYTCKFVWFAVALDLGLYAYDADRYLIGFVG